MDKLLSKTTGKAFIANIIIGALYFIVVGTILGAIGSAIGIENPQDFEEIASDIASFQPIPILFAIFALIILGAFVWIFAIINKMLHAKIGAKQNLKVDFKHRPVILAFAGVGFVWLWLITGLNAFFGAFGGDINVLDGGTLLSALAEFRIDIIIVSLIGLGVTGWLITQSSKLIPAISDNIPDKLKPKGI